MSEKKAGFLEGHRRRGKRFSPPLMQFDAISEVRWIDDLLPEFLWIGLLIDLHGIRRTLRILEGIVDAGPRLGPEGEAWLSRASTFSTLDLDAAQDLTRKLQDSGHLADLQTAVGPLVAHYPACPLQCLFHDGTAVGDIDPVRNAVAHGLDRWSEHASWVQIAAVYVMIGQGKLHFPEDSVLARFPEVEDYPDTRISRMIASACRALINSLPASERSEASRMWTEYFWARGLELEPCSPIRIADDDE